MNILFLFLRNIYTSFSQLWAWCTQFLKVFIVGTIELCGVHDFMDESLCVGVHDSGVLHAFTLSVQKNAILI